MKTKNFDVLVIGGGLVGASLVCALDSGLDSAIRERGLKVGLVESHDIDQPMDIPPSYDARASALSYGTSLIYEQLGLWQPLAEQATSIQKIHVSDKGHFGVTRLSALEQEVPALGYVIENFRIGEVLLERLKSYREQSLVDVLSPARVEQLSPRARASMEAIVQLGDERIRLQTKLVVLADGGRSSLMDKLGITRKKYDYQQHAVIANVSVNQPHHGQAWERFAGDGPMALLPLTGDRCAMVWTLPSDRVDQYLAMDDAQFLETIQECFGFGAGRFTQVGQRDSYPLSLGIAQEQVRPGLVILGNAAHSMHPVAGQGYNLAVRDTMALAENIMDSLDSGDSPGNLARLLEYVETQRGDQSTTLGFCDALVKLFTRKELPVILARNLGLVGMNVSPSLKSAFTRKAMGL